MRRILIGLAILAASMPGLGFADELHALLESEDTGIDSAARERLSAEPDLDVAAQDDLQRTYLHLAARYGHTETAAWLLDHGAAVNAQAYNRFTPLNLAARFGRVEMIALLLERGADASMIDAVGMTPMAAAASSGQTAAVDALKGAGVSVDLHAAVLLGDAVRVEALVISDASKVDSAILIAAAGTGNLAVVKLLHGAGAPLDVPGFAFTAPLHAAIVGGHVDVADYLIAEGADLDREVFWNPLGNLTPLMAAAWYDQAEIIEALVEAGAPVDATNDDGKRALDFATMNTSTAAQAALQAASAD